MLKVETRLFPSTLETKLYQIIMSNQLADQRQNRIIRPQYPSLEKKQKNLSTEMRIMEPMKKA